MIFVNSSGIMMLYILSTLTVKNISCNCLSFEALCRRCVIAREMTKVHEEVIQQTQHAIMSSWDIYLVTSTELVCFSFGVAHLKRRMQSFQIVVHEAKLHLSYKGCRKLTLKDQQMKRFSLSSRRLWLMVSASPRWLLKTSFGCSCAENLNLLHMWTWFDCGFAGS